MSASLEDALERSSDQDAIVMVDDNIASGTQSGRQLKLWLNAKARRPHPNSNYFARPLRSSDVLKQRNIHFAFALGLDDGRARLINDCKSNGLAVTVDRIQFGELLANWSGKATASTPIDLGLRDFLRHVGKSLFGPSPEEEIVGPQHESKWERKALGYDNLEGLVVTPFNVPTSTYTALWLPGAYVPEGAPQDAVIAWWPLFIRQGMFRRLVLA